MTDSRDTPFTARASELREAAEFMAHVREIQARSGTPLAGRAHLSDDVSAASSAAQGKSKLLTALRNEPGGLAFAAATERFEEMCRRRRLYMSDRLRPFVYRLLAVEIETNAGLLGAGPLEVAPATVYGGVFDWVDDAEFASLRDAPGVFRHAAVNNPTAAHEYLRGVLRRLHELENDGEFTDFSSHRGVLVEAAAKHATNPKGFLRKYRATHDWGASSGRNDDSPSR